MTERTPRPRMRVYAQIETEWFLQCTVELHAKDDESKTTECSEIAGPTRIDDLLVTVIIPKLQSISGGQIIDDRTEISRLFSTISDAEIVEGGKHGPPSEAEPDPPGSRPGPVKRMLLAIGHFMQAAVKYTWETFIKGLGEAIVDKFTRGP